MFTFSFKAVPALNDTEVLAAILIVSPVFGFLPSLAALLDNLNVPNPATGTFSPFSNWFAIPPSCPI